MSRQWYEELYENFANYDQEPYAQNTLAEVDLLILENVVRAQAGRHVHSDHPERRVHADT